MSYGARFDGVALKVQAGNAAPNVMSGKCRTGKWRTNVRKMVTLFN